MKNQNKNLKSPAIMTRKNKFLNQSTEQLQSSDDEGPVYVFDESSYGIRKKSQQELNSKKNSEINTNIAEIKTKSNKLDEDE